MSGFEHSLINTCGNDVFISANVEIRRPKFVDIGDHVAIDSGFYCTTRLLVKDYIHIGPYVSVIGGEKTSLILLGFNTIGAGSRVLCASDEFLGAGLVGLAPLEFRDNVICAPIVFEMFSSVGTNVVIHPGVKLAEGSVVGSCSLVTHDTEPWMIYYGMPARAIKKRRREKMIAAAKSMGYTQE